MVKKQLIEILAEKQPDIQKNDVELAVNAIIQQLVDTIASNERVEIRGFGAFSLHRRQAQIARNPKTGESLCVDERHTVYFKPGLDLRNKVNINTPIID